MPEIGEVARMVHYLRKHLVNRTIKSCQAFEDDIVYGKVGCSGSAFQKAVEGKTVTGAGQQGKYFYVTFDSSPHSVMHLGMTGWIRFNTEVTGYYRQAKEKEKEEEWPPKYMKWLIKCEAEKFDGHSRDAVEVAFVDPRRLARIRLVECEADTIRQASPLKENGPDPVIDKDILTVEWLASLLRRKKVPVKALLLDQGNISGVGNWVADEVLYQAKLHPEQYSNTFSDEQVKQLHDALVGVCTIACETLADSDQFPENWLMKYRWDKGKKASNVLPNGEKIMHLTVGGRTSAIVPSVQKKTAAVAGDIDPNADENESTEQKIPAKGRKRKSRSEQKEDVSSAEETSKKPVLSRGKTSQAKPGVNDDQVEKPKPNARAKKSKVEHAPEVNGATRKGKGNDQVEEVKAKPDSAKIKANATVPKKAEKSVTPGSRRSSRRNAS